MKLLFTPLNFAENIQKRLFSNAGGFVVYFMRLNCLSLAFASFSQQKFVWKLFMERSRLVLDL